MGCDYSRCTLQYPSVLGLDGTANAKRTRGYINMEKLWTGEIARVDRKIRL